MVATLMMIGSLGQTGGRPDEAPAIAPTSPAQEAPLPESDTAPEPGPGSSPAAGDDSSTEAEDAIGAIAIPPTVPGSPQAAGPQAFLTALPSGLNVAIIRIEGMIHDFTYESLQRRVDRAIAGGAQLIVIEFDTMGGKVTSALDMSKYLRSLNVPTIAWINNDAYSAGILIASACDAIVMSRSSSTGDCAPIIPGGQIASTERAKTVSAIKDEFESSARDNGYDFDLFHAMCLLGVEVYLIEDPTTGEQRMVNQVDYAIMVKGQDLEEAERMNLSVALNLPPAVREGATAADQLVGNTIAVWSASSTLDGAQIEASKGKWKLIKRVHDGKTLLTVDEVEALEMGLSVATISSETELSRLIQAGSISRVEQSWSEDAAGWLAHPAIRAVLILALLLGAYAEFQVPGVGVPGAVAVVALILLLAPPLIVGLADVWEIILFFVGLVLLAAEIFVTTGFGVLGAIGLICIFSSLVLMVVPSGSGP